MTTTKPRRKSLKKIKSHGLMRNLALGKLTVLTGVRHAGHTLTNWITGSSEERTLDMLLKQALQITSELGTLKGSVLKMGQMLSVLGEHFLPPKVNEVLKLMQSESIPLDWPVIEKALKSQLEPEILAKLKIEQEAYGTASLGQVHLAKWKNQTVALKVQYPGVAKAIDSDVKTLKFILNMANFIPGEIDLEPIFDEIKTMLRQELDYGRELKNTHAFAELLKGDKRYVVPQGFAELSTKRVLATSFEPGVRIDSDEVMALSQERRNRLALSLLELYFRELFEWRLVQTDPHFGNYSVRLNDNGEDQIVLYDFGAVRSYSKKFMHAYARMVRGLLLPNHDEFLAGAHEMGFLQSEDSPELTQAFSDFCQLIAEPFHEGVYHWAESDLPKRLITAGSQIARSFHLRTPPRELVFLDRKTAGIFTLLSKLGAEFSAREMALKYVTIAPD